MAINYRVSINGWSRIFTNREDALASAKECAANDRDAAIKVYNPFNNVIWES